MFFVAGWLSLSPVVTDSEEGPIARPWLDTKIDFKKTTSSTKNITALFSSNDPYVPSENVKLFKELLNAKTLVEKDMGHYDDDSGTTKIPVMLKYF
jgi:predicted alpha/beta hydrolase family esterase